MKIYKFIIYSIILIILIGGPIYAVGRLVLPAWVKSQIAANLPKGSSLVIGEMSSNSDLSINYDNLNYKSASGLLNLNLSKIVIRPQLSLKEPLEIKVGTANFETDQLSGKFSKVNSKIAINFKDLSETTLTGQAEKLDAHQFAALSNINFFLKGFNTKNSTIEFSAEKFKIFSNTPMGQIITYGENAIFNASLNNDLYTIFKSQEIEFDISSFSNDQSETVIKGNDLFLDLSLVKNENWFAPFVLKLKNISSKGEVISEDLMVNAEGRWRNTMKSCTWRYMLIDNQNCGKLTDIVKVNLEMIKDDSILNFSGEGICVTPKAGCLQKINSKIRTRKTADVFSRIMASGTINPIFAGVIFGSLLSSPKTGDPNYDHEVIFEVKGSIIVLNGKPLIN